MNRCPLFQKAFRPSDFGQSEDRSILADMTRMANIRRYPRMVSLGLRLFEAEAGEAGRLSARLARPSSPPIVPKAQCRPRSADE